MIETGLVAKLLSVMGDDVEGVHKDVLPQGAPVPALVHTIISVPRESHLMGQTDLVFAQVQIDCLADSALVAMQLAETLRLGFNGFRGTMGDHIVTSVKLGNTFDDPQDPEMGGEARIHRRITEWTIGYTESVPLPY